MPSAIDPAPRSRAAAAGSVELWVAVAVSLIGALIVVRRMGPFFVDDAYITMRFAQNLTSGAGWTYNAGEQTANGATSPGFTMAVAALSVPLRAATRASNILFAGSFGAIAAFLGAMLRRRQAPGVALATMVALVTCPLLMATKGMESLPFLALVCGVLWASASGRDAWFGVLAVLLTLVRGEGALLALTVFAWMWASRRQMPTRALGAAGLAALPWAAYSLVALDGLLPNTLTAKIAQGDSGFWGEGWVFFSWTRLVISIFHVGGWLTIVGPLALAGLVRGCADRRLRAIVVPLTTATALHFLAYGLVLNVPGYHWYYAWEVFTLSLLAAIAAGWLVELGIAAVRSARLQTTVRFAATSVAGAGVLVAATTTLVDASDMLLYREGPQYADLGRWLETNTEPGARIAATEIGTIGWFSQRPIVDYLGLLSTHSAKELRRGDLATWLEREEPDYWVVHEPLWPHEAPAAKQDWFPLAYEPVMTTEPGGLGARLVVYRRTMDIAKAKALIEHRYGSAQLP